jgi:RsiW-degrading membrane proteinase PrsW (M82 family)
VPKLVSIQIRRDLAISAALVIAAVGLAALLAARTPLGIDYSGPVHPACDCPGGPIRALAHGDLHGFVEGQPVMGPVSLLVRAPFAALGLHVAHGSELTLYRFGVFPCLLAGGLLAIVLFRRMRERRRAALACLLIPVLVAFNPLTTRALKFGHPEEILAAVLCVAAVLAATRKRPLLAGLLLGAAIATKQWALMAALPVALANREHLWRVLAATGATAALFIVPVALGDIHRFVELNHGAGIVGGGVMPTNIWFGFGHNVPITLGPNGSSTPPREISHAIGSITHPLILLTAAALALAWWRRGRTANPEDALLLIALIMLARCLLDPLTNSYYHLPFLVSLAAWEGLRREGAPVLTVAASLFLGLTISLVNSGINLEYVNRLYLLWTLPFAALLAIQLYRPRRAPAILPGTA